MIKILLNITLILVTFFACYLEDIYLLFWSPQPHKTLPIAIRAQQFFSYDQEKALKNAEEIEFPYTQPSIINDDFRSVDISDATIVYFDNYGYTIEETEEALSRVPEGCLVIYQDHGHVSGDRFLPFPTAFSATTAKDVDPLEAFWRSHISYRFV